MITDKLQIRPRYGEVDQMGYVYHANYVSYCHQARTELMRKLNIHDRLLESNNIMMPVIAFDINYKKPAGYDDIITIQTTLIKTSEVRLHFEFIIGNENKETIGTAKSTVVFVDTTSRKPMRIPKIVSDTINSQHINK